MAPNPWPWPEGPEYPPAPGHDVHVWIADIRGDGEAGDVTLNDLSVDEKQRARDAHSITYRNEFVRTRQALRGLLGRYLNLAPSAIVFYRNQHGKLYLAPPLDQVLQFNLSHTAGVALFALTGGGEVGVDMDRIDRVANWQGIAARSFSAQEQNAVAGFPEAERGSAFMRAWIRKEAYTKARGSGFQYGFSRFTVSLEQPSSSSLLVEDTRDAAAREQWFVQDIGLPPPLAAALATAISPRSGRPVVHCWRL